MHQRHWRNLFGQVAQCTARLGSDPSSRRVAEVSSGNLTQTVTTSLQKLYHVEEAIVVGSVAQAIDLLSRHPEFRNRWSIPRVDCIRLPRQNSSTQAVDVRDMLNYSHSDIEEIGASNECARVDFERVLQAGQRAVLTCWPSGLDQANAWSPHRDWAVDLAHQHHGIAAELLLVGTTYPLHDSSFAPPSIADRLSQGLDIAIIPGAGLLADRHAGSSSVTPKHFDRSSRSQIVLDCTPNPQLWQPWLQLSKNHKPKINGSKPLSVQS